jgi:hypothetical protein
MVSVLAGLLGMRASGLVRPLSQHALFQVFCRTENPGSDSFFPKLMIDCLDILDDIWVFKKAGYMQFGEILKDINAALVSTLELHVSTYDELRNVFRSKALAAIHAENSDSTYDSGPRQKTTSVSRHSLMLEKKAMAQQQGFSTIPEEGGEIQPDQMQNRSPTPSQGPPPIPKRPATHKKTISSLSAEDLPDAPAPPPPVPVSRMSVAAKRLPPLPVRPKNSARRNSYRKCPPPLPLKQPPSLGPSVAVFNPPPRIQPPTEPADVQEEEFETMAEDQDSVIYEPDEEDLIEKLERVRAETTGMTVFCHQCGVGPQIDVKFCGDCGEQLFMVVE